MKALDDLVKNYEDTPSNDTPMNKVISLNDSIKQEDIKLDNTNDAINYKNVYSIDLFDRNSTLSKKPTNNNEKMNKNNDIYSKNFSKPKQSFKI